MNQPTNQSVNQSASRSVADQPVNAPSNGSRHPSQQQFSASHPETGWPSSESGGPVPSSGDSVGASAKQPAVTPKTVDNLVRIRPWWDPELAISGFSARSAYCERYWLPVMGPSATLLIRLAADMCAAHPSGVTMQRAELARSLGLGKSIGPNGPLARAMLRLEYFGMAREVAGAFETRTHLPPVNAALLRRVPKQLRDNHSNWLLRHSADSPTVNAGRSQIQNP